MLYFMTSTEKELMHSVYCLDMLQNLRCFLLQTTVVNNTADALLKIVREIGVRFARVRSRFSCVYFVVLCALRPHKR